MIYIDVYFKKYGWCQFGAFRTSSVSKVAHKSVAYARHWQIGFKYFKVRCDDGREYNVADLRSKGVITCVRK